MRFKLPRVLQDAREKLFSKARSEEDDGEPEAPEEQRTKLQKLQAYWHSVRLKVQPPPEPKVLSPSAHAVFKKDFEARDVHGDGVLSVAEAKAAPTTKEGQEAVQAVLDELAELSNVECLAEYDTVHINDILGRTESKRCKRVRRPRGVGVVLFFSFSLILLCTIDKEQRPCASDLTFNGVAYRRLSHEEVPPEASAILVVNAERFTASDICPEHWNFIEGMYFIVGTIFGVGYGDLVPRSVGLKFFVVIFIIVSAVLLFGAASRIAVASYFKTQRLAEEMLLKRQLSFLMRPIFMAASWAMMVYLVLVVVGALSMMSLEDWSMSKSLYWAVGTCVKLGYGDVVPSNEGSKAFAATYIVVVFLAMSSSLLGLVCAHVLVMAMRKGSAQLKKPRSLRAVADLARAASDHVDQGDFLAAMLLALGKLKPGEAEPILRRFRQLDVDGSGTIQSRELQVFRHQHLTCRTLLEEELSLLEQDDKAVQKAIHQPLPADVPLDPVILKFVLKVQRLCRFLCMSCTKRCRRSKEPDTPGSRPTSSGSSRAGSRPNSREAATASRDVPESRPSSKSESRVSSKSRIESEAVDHFPKEPVAEPAPKAPADDPPSNVEPADDPPSLPGMVTHPPRDVLGC